MLFSILAALYPIQISPNVLGKAAEDGPTSCVPAPIHETEMEFQVSGFGPRALWPFGVVTQQIQDLSLSLSITLSYK